VVILHIEILLTSGVIEVYTYYNNLYVYGLTGVLIGKAATSNSGSCLLELLSALLVGPFYYIGICLTTRIDFFICTLLDIIMEFNFNIVRFIFISMAHRFFNMIRYFIFNCLWTISGFRTIFMVLLIRN
jgi:hypothetical protein